MPASPSVGALAWTALAVAAALPLAASTLAERSPFLPPGYGSGPSQEPTPVTAPVSPDLELKGLYEFNGQMYYFIFNRRENEGSWVGPESHQESYRIRNFDFATRTLVLQADGQEVSLPLTSAGFVLGQNYQQPVVPPAFSQSGGAGGNAEPQYPRRRTLVRNPPPRFVTPPSEPGTATSPPAMEVSPPTGSEERASPTQPTTNASPRANGREEEPPEGRLLPRRQVPLE